MKKFNLKTLLILVLALILVFSLVACNKDAPTEDNTNPTEDVTDPTVIKSQKFFDDLWEASNSIGSDEISDTDDIGVSADMSLKVLVKDKKAVYKEIDLGIAFQLVYDRDFEAVTTAVDPVTNNSALKIKLYNAKTNANWITLYYFLSDAENLYMDYDNQNVVFTLDTGFNDTWAGALRDAMASNVFGTTSISDILKAITDTTGEDFNLNDLVNVILDIVGEATNFDISTLISQNKKLLEETLGIKGIYENEKVNLKAVFNSSIIKGFLKNSKCVVADDGSKAYSTDIVLSTTISGALASLLGDLGDIVNNIGVNLSFGVDANSKIDGFKITADLAGLSVKDASNANKNVWPAIELSINTLEFAPISNATFATAKTYFGMTKTYSSEVSLDMALVIDSKGVTLMPGKVNEYSQNATDNFALDGKYILRVQGNGNVKENEDFYLYAYLAKVNGSTEEKAIQLAYNGEKLIINLDKNVQSSNGVSIVETLANSLGEFAYDAMLNAHMNSYAQALIGKTNSLLVAATAPATGYVLNPDAASTYTLDVDLLDLVEWAAGQIGAFINSLGQSSSAAEETVVVDKYPIAMKSLKTIVADVISAIDTEDGLTVALSGDKSLITYMNSWFKLNGSNVTAQTQEAWYPRSIVYNANWYEAFKAIGFKAIAGTNTYQDLTKDQTEAMWNFALGYFSADNKESYLEDNQTKFTVATNKVGESIDPLDLLFGDRFVKFAGITDSWYKVLFNLSKASVSLGLDDGLEIAISAQLNDQTKATVTLTVAASTAFNATDLKTIYDNLDKDTAAFDIGEVTFN